jgi:KUP system potassium uptake protein
MTTVLLAVYLKRKKFPNYLIYTFLAVYLVIELTFLASNLAKILHGGWFTLVLGSILFSVMWAWSSARRIKNRFVRFVEIEEYYPIIKELSEDETVPKYASQLVYLTSANFSSEIELKIMYSILQKQPKRADVYWLVHVDVVDEPYTSDYKVDFLIPDKLIRIDFKLGFRVEQRINVLFRKVVEDLVKNKEIDITSKYPSLQKHQIVGDFKFVVLEKVLSKSNKLPFIERFIMDYYFILRKLSLSEEKGFGLDSSFVTIERVPLIVSTVDDTQLKRV